MASSPKTIPLVFGIEIEAFGLNLRKNIKDLCDALAQALNAKVTSPGEFDEPKYETWHLTLDATAKPDDTSLRGLQLQFPKESEDPTILSFQPWWWSPEIISPILQDPPLAWMDEVSKVVRVLGEERFGLRTSSQTGLHIHISVSREDGSGQSRRFTLEELKKIGILWLIFEEAMLAGETYERQRNKYIKSNNIPIAGFTYREKYEAMQAQRESVELVEYMHGGSRSKFFSLNFTETVPPKHKGIIEFRAFESSLVPGLVCGKVSTALCFVRSCLAASDSTIAKLVRRSDEEESFESKFELKGFLGS